MLVKLNAGIVLELWVEDKKLVLKECVRRNFGTNKLNVSVYTGFLHVNITVENIIILPSSYVPLPCNGLL